MGCPNSMLSKSHSLVSSCHTDTHHGAVTTSSCHRAASILMPQYVSVTFTLMLRPNRATTGPHQMDCVNGAIKTGFFHPTCTWIAHPSSILYPAPFIQWRATGGLEPISADMGERRGISWTSRQFITAEVLETNNLSLKHTQTHTHPPKGNL